MTEQASSVAPPREARFRRFSLVVLGAGVVCLVGSLVLGTLLFSGIWGGSHYSGPHTVLFPTGDISKLLTPPATATPDFPDPSDAPIARLTIPRFDIDAPVVVRGMDANRVMEVPDGPTDVAWYNFTAKPGYGSNAVFAGHVDYINYGAAVFYHISELKQGDLIEVHLIDGTVYYYKVATIEQVDAATADVGKIVGPAPNDIVTLITCGGAWDAGAHAYNQRVIVRAERVLNPDTPAVSTS